MKKSNMEPIKRLMQHYNVTRHFARLLARCTNNPQIESVLHRARRRRKSR